MTWERLLRQIAFALVLFVLINFVDATRIPATSGLRRYLAYAFTTDWDYRGTLAQAKVLASFTGKLRLPGLTPSVTAQNGTVTLPQAQVSKPESPKPAFEAATIRTALPPVGGETVLTGELGRGMTGRVQPAPTRSSQEPASRTESAGEEPTAALGMVWPYNAAVVEPYGRRRHPILNIIGIHEGIDIAAPMGSKVIAAQSGVVKRLVYNARAGRAIEIEHSGGLSTFYAHLDSIAVHEKDKVSKGDVIGISGRSGLVTGPHLHFEVRKSGQPVDPTPYLSAR